MNDLATMSAGGAIDRSREEEATKSDRPIQFFKVLQGLSKQCSGDSDVPDARPGLLLLGADQVLKEIRVLPAPVGARFHAVYTIDDEVVEETYEDGSPTWNLIASVVSKKELDSSPHKNTKGQKRARVGLEVLCWAGDHGCFTVVGFFNTARSEAKAVLKARDNKTVIGIKGKKCEYNGNTWYIPKPFDCGRVESNWPMPTPTQQQAALEAFLKPTLEKDAPPEDTGPPR